MRVKVNMCEPNSIIVEGVNLNKRAAAEYLAEWILAQCDVIWPKENEDAENEPS